MRTSHTPDHHHLYASTPQHYPPVRRSARHSHQYLPPGTPVAMSPPQYHSSSMPAHYALNLSPYPPAHTLSSEGTSGSGYLDSFPGINMPNVMQMSMDPAPMGMDLSILSAEEHHDLHMIEERTSPSGSPSHPTDRSEQKQRQRRAQSDDSIDTPPKAGGKKQRGRPRLDPKDENAADVSTPPASSFLN